VSIQPAKRVVIDEFISHGHGGMRNKYHVLITNGDESVYPSCHSGYQDMTCSSLRDALDSAKYFARFFDLEVVHRRGLAEIPVDLTDGADG